jgi:hypothetical protein
MSALGHERTFAVQYGMSALPPKADIRQHEWNVRFGPKADIRTSFDHLVGTTMSVVGDVMRKQRNKAYRLAKPLPMFGHAGSVRRKLVR